jgi:hypothetical protein
MPVFEKCKIDHPLRKIGYRKKSFSLLSFLIDNTSLICLPQEFFCFFFGKRELLSYILPVKPSGRER